MKAETYNEFIRHWEPISNILSFPKSNDQCDKMIDLLNNLLDETGNNENHSLFPLIETLGTLIENYESKTIPEPDTTSAEILKYLINENKLSLKDLVKLGTEEEINELIHA